ncbi:MAG: glycosyltransferase family 4 protein [Kiritimatiellae bacterium]|nr:glycosyltransferase family 4 protein [Kiritimatiellia bacterium]
MKRVTGKRILYVSSSRAPWFESQDCVEHYANAPYSIDAIAYNLEKIGWTVGWSGWKGSVNPFKLARRIDEFKPDVIYTYGALVSLHPMICRRLLCRHKAFVVVHGWDDHYGRIWGDLLGLPGRLFMDWMEKRIVKNSDAVVTLSYELQKIGRGWGVECKYIPNGADPVDDLPRSETTKLDGRFKIVYTGDKARWKRTIDICEAMRHVPDDIKLYLTGRKEDYLMPYASGNCVFLGWLTKEEQRGVMAQADAFVCTSNQDCNAKLQEYLRWRKPILALDGEANNFFRNGETALLAKDGDYAPLLLRLANDPALCRRIADNAARDIPVFSWREIAEQFDGYFRSVMK